MLWIFHEFAMNGIFSQQSRIHLYTPQSNLALFFFHVIQHHWIFIGEKPNSMAELMQIEPQYILLWQQIGRTLIFHRWAGLSGALAIIFTVFVENCKLSNFDKHFVTLANQINYVHALILMAVPLTRRPNLVRKTIEGTKKKQILGKYFILLPLLSFVDRYFIPNWNGCVLSWKLFLCINQLQWIHLLQQHWQPGSHSGLAFATVLKFNIFFC